MFTSMNCRKNVKDEIFVLCKIFCGPESLSLCISLALRRKNLQLFSAREVVMIWPQPRCVGTDPIHGPLCPSSQVGIGGFQRVLEDETNQEELLTPGPWAVRVLV